MRRGRDDRNRSTGDLMGRKPGDPASALVSPGGAGKGCMRRTAPVPPSGGIAADARASFRVLADDRRGHSQSGPAPGHRKTALAHFLAGYGDLENPVDTVLQRYYAPCSISASCRDLALSDGFLACHGLCADGSRPLSRSEVKRVNAVLLTCGTYDAACDFAHRVGLPGKSGVGGGILAVVPGKGARCALSPALDPAGNSVAAVQALDAFTTMGVVRLLTGRAGAGLSRAAPGSRSGGPGEPESGVIPSERGARRACSSSATRSRRPTVPSEGSASIPRTWTGPASSWTPAPGSSAGRCCSPRASCRASTPRVARCT
ncbi:hypothetical protein GCM10020367_62300 [Streptomyces sannanensis]|uniref:glutaminase n=1 Tax=Streptomyces sannanensis TaxID=285536 RepID=A0ABP6SKY2_9ACTN